MFTNRSIPKARLGVVGRRSPRRFRWCCRPAAAKGSPHKLAASQGSQGHQVDQSRRCNPAEADSATDDSNLRQTRKRGGARRFLCLCAHVRRTSETRPSPSPAITTATFAAHREFQEAIRRGEGRKAPSERDRAPLENGAARRSGAPSKRSWQQARKTAPRPTCRGRNQKQQPHQSRLLLGKQRVAPRARAFGGPFHRKESKVTLAVSYGAAPRRPTAGPRRRKRDRRSHTRKPRSGTGPFRLVIEGDQPGRWTGRPSPSRRTASRLGARRGDHHTHHETGRRIRRNR